MSENIEQDWVFTFGMGQNYQNCYTKIYGSFEGARSEMINRFGQKWSMQYTNEEAAGVNQFHLKEIH